MDIQFHYYCLRVLAQIAGLKPEEAAVVAYASQYVDDATEHKPITVRNAPAEADDQHIAGRFDPICSAHSGIQLIASFKDDVQRKIYLPFHFLPPKRYRGTGAFDYLVQPDGTLANELLELGLDELRRTAKAPTAQRLRALIKTGIALHTYADTWSHQDFSGRHAAGDNDLRERARFEGGGWQPLGFFEEAALNILPDIGHAEASTMPDCAALRWRYRKSRARVAVERDNTKEFLAAATRILARLGAVTGTTAAVPPALRSCLLAADAKSWFANFPAVFGTRPREYNELTWRKAALTDGTVDWRTFKSAEDFAAQCYTFNGDLKWFLFHSEAGKQRDFALRRVRYDLA